MIVADEDRGVEAFSGAALVPADDEADEDGEIDGK